MPYEWMLPFLIPEIHQDKATELKALFDKYEVCYSQTGFTIIYFSFSPVLKIILVCGARICHITNSFVSFVLEI
jgi:hypothetical protein